MAGKPAQEIVEAEVVEENLPSVPQPSLFPALNAWDNLDSADVMASSGILEIKSRLIGVPFVVTKVVYRQGSYVRPKEAIPSDYVSLEVVTAPTLNRLYVPERIEKYRRQADKAMTGSLREELHFEVDDYVGPDEFVVLNDSSTGIKRQMTAYLAHRGIITVDLDGDLPPMDGLIGKLGENVFDQDRDEWSRGKEVATNGVGIKLVCRSGLRVSAYETGASDSATFYLA